MAEGRPPSGLGQVVIAGASGFIGRALCRALAAQRHVVALSRRPVAPDDPTGVTWRQANLFNLRHTESALAGSRIGLYLVHSMLPTARLSQGHFSDMDLICADNFARAAKSQGIERIIYLSGLIPEERPLSTHLASRLEVEQALADHGVPVTTLRAGLVIGPGGSSCTLMLRLVERLPIMVLPGWTASRCQPVALADVVRLTTACIDDPHTAGETFDIGGPDVLTYRQMLAACAQALGRRRLWLPVPLQAPALSLGWVSAITGSPLELVRPLVTSLRHDMVVRRPGARADFAPATCMPFDQALAQAIRPDTMASGSAVLPPEASASQRLPLAPRHTAPSALPATQMASRARGVVSVQRLPLPPGRDARWVAARYGAWLPQALWRTLGWVLRVETSTALGGRPEEVRFILRGVGRLLLCLQLAPARSNADRQLYYITGGLLARPTDAEEPGRFEFRTVLGRKHVLAAIHDFVPRLPWLVYKASQAVVHAWVMGGFAAALRRDCAVSPSASRLKGP